MTAEIAVMNRQGVALAADSAVTFQGARGPKIFSSADKIFALSKHQPIGVMVYGTAMLNDVPWETVVKVYRAQLGDRQFETVQGYADDFLAFLASNTVLFTAESKERFVFISALRLFGHIKASMLEQVEKAVESSSKPLTVAESRRAALKAIAAHHRNFAARTDRPDVDNQLAANVSSTYEEAINAAKEYIFEDFPLPKGASKKLSDLVLFVLTKEGFSGDSGVVIAGFGTKEVFPNLVEYEVDGVVLDHLVRWTGRLATVSADDSAFVQGFAQSDVIHLFMEGVTSEYEEFVEGYVSQVIEQYGDIVINGLGSAAGPPLKGALRDAEKQIMDGLRQEFYEQRRALYVDPILDVVASLPKDELGMMAESLVNLTSLKRRISMEHETVGGPIDVAVISKGDGLVWTKRKHYFDASLNHHFFSNYFRSVRDGEA